jgi:predicted nucleic acid-binding protein
MVADNPKFYIVDSSVYLSYLLPDEKLPSSLKSIINKFINNKVDFAAPAIIKYEIGNSMKSAVKQKRVSDSEAIMIYNTFLEFPIHFFSPNYQETLKIATNLNLSFYDASYLALAIEKNTKLLTLDKKLLTCLSK